MSQGKDTDTKLRNRGEREAPGFHGFNTNLKNIPGRGNGGYKGGESKKKLLKSTKKPEGVRGSRGIIHQKTQKERKQGGETSLGGSYDQLMEHENKRLSWGVGQHS